MSDKSRQNNPNELRQLEGGHVGLVSGVDRKERDTLPRPSVHLAQILVKTTSDVTTPTSVEAMDNSAAFRTVTEVQFHVVSRGLSYELQF